jgi:hypothetical protein
MYSDVFLYVGDIYDVDRICYMYVHTIGTFVTITLICKLSNLTAFNGKFITRITSTAK